MAWVKRFFYGLEPDVIAAFAGSVSIAVQGQATLGPIATPNAKGAVRALAGCVRDQLIEWGADPAQFEPGGKMPVALVPRDDWVPSATLLKIPVPSDGQVDAVFKVTVAANGAVDGCTQIGTGVDAKSATLACDSVLTRRLFTPANDAQGKPVRGAAVFEIHLYSERTYNGG